MDIWDISNRQEIIELSADLAALGGGNYRGAAVQLAANQSIPNATETPLSWGSAAINTPGIFTLTNPTRLTVPVGVSSVKLCANVAWEANSTGDREMVLKKNGSLVEGGFNVNMKPTANEAKMNAITASIAVNVGDYFELQVRQTSGGSLLVAGWPVTWFSLEVVR